MILSLFFVVVSALASEPQRHYIVNSKILKLIDGPARVVTSEQDLHLVRLTERQILKLSKKIHEDKGICGGFVDIEHVKESIGVSPEGAFLSRAAKLNTRFTTSGESLRSGFSRTALLYPSQVQSTLPLVEQGTLEGHLKTLSSQNDRFSKGQGGIDATENIKRIMKPFIDNNPAVKVTFKNIPSPKPFVMDTVVATLEGTDPSLPGIVIGGHLDTFQTNKPGADDDGSGSATVLTVFEAVMKSKMTFKHSIHFAFYAAEEYGLIGSQQMVDYYIRNKIPIMAVVQFDMTGFNSTQEDGAIYLVNDFTDPGLNNFMRSLATTYLHLNAEQIGTTRCGYACSDHASWMEEGIPATIPFEASLSHMNMNLHTARDTMSVIDMNHAFRFVQLGIAFAVELGEPN